MDFLKSEFGIDWIVQEKIEKIDPKTRKATNEDKSILLKLSDDEKKVTLFIDNNLKDEFIVKKDNNKLYICYESVANIPEKDLNFIITCAYAINGNEGCNSLLKIVCAHELPENYESESNPIWLEAMPLKGRSSPTLDIAFGDLKHPNDDKTEARIVYKPPPNESGRICFVEMKTIEDIDSSSTDNPKYNQLAKYIRASLIFQNAGKFPKAVHVTLVTPRIFIKKPKSRFYGYKFIEYACPEINPDNIISDIELPIENEEREDDWIKYDMKGMNERLPFLKLHWIPYEDIFDEVPNNHLKDYINRIRDANPIFDKPPETK